MIADALAAFLEILSPPFRATLAKVLALTVAVLALAIWALHHVLLGLVTLPSSWLATLVSILTGLGLVAGSVFLVGPVSALVAGFFIDGLADHVERDIDPSARPGRPLPALWAIALGARFALLSLGVTVLALLLLLVPGVNAVAFLGANAYLSARQYYEFVALRHLPRAEAEALRHRAGPRLFLAGLIIAGFLAVPVLNLLTPLFATAFMVRVFKRLPAGPVQPVALGPG